MMTLIAGGGVWFGTVLLLFLLVCLFTLLLIAWLRSMPKKRSQIGFFHPHCSSGGGGERVLWKMVQVLSQFDHLSVVIYTVDSETDNYKPTILQHVRDRFNLDISESFDLEFVHLHNKRHWLEPSPFLSLLMESWNTMRLAFCGLLTHIPDVYIDTTGCAFTFWPARLLGCRCILAYVHYPTISTDMLSLVYQTRRGSYNHSQAIASSKLKTCIKLIYYCFFSVWYGLTGSLATHVLVNSTWTYNHVRSLWKVAGWRNKIDIVYPPCSIVSVTHNNNNKATKRQRQNIILSIGQFRPEKDHVLQLEALQVLLQRYSSCQQGKHDNNNMLLPKDLKLVLIGSCRNQSDRDRLSHLQTLSQTLGVQPYVEFVVNQPYSVVVEYLRKASIGIHTMWNEHFGIGIVEMMAAGLIVVAHNSGGPRSDIVVDYYSNNNRQSPNHGEGIATTGFLATTADEYAEKLYAIVTMKNADADILRANAAASAERFTDDVFADSFRQVIASHL